MTGVREVLLLLTVVVSSACPSDHLVASSRMPLQARAGMIVDKNGCPIHFACVNWYGAHMELFSVDGLNKQPLGKIAARIVELGFNCLRLPFSLQLLYENPVVPSFALTANPELQGMRGMELFDKTVEAATRAGLMVILNNHNSMAGWCCNIESPEGLWHTPEFPLERWYNSVQLLAERYLGNPLVVGYDLRNEIHDVGDTAVTWGSSQDPLSDWRVASTEAAKILQASNPDMLAIVSGLCWGQDLRAMRSLPPRVDGRPLNLVYTSHTYEWSLWWMVLAGRLKAMGVAGGVQEPDWWGRLKRTLHVNASVAGATGTLVCAVWAAIYLRFGPDHKMPNLREIWLTLGVWLGLGGLALLMMALAYKSVMDAYGCSFTGADSHAAIVWALLMTVVGILIVVPYPWKAPPRQPSDPASQAAADDDDSTQAHGSEPPGGRRMTQLDAAQTHGFDIESHVAAQGPAEAGTNDSAATRYGSEGGQSLATEVRNGGPLRNFPSPGDVGMPEQRGEHGDDACTVQVKREQAESQSRAKAMVIRQGGTNAQRAGPLVVRTDSEASDVSTLMEGCGTAQESCEVRGRGCISGQSAGGTGRKEDGSPRLGHREGPMRGDSYVGSKENTSPRHVRQRPGVERGRLVRVAGGALISAQTLCSAVRRKEISAWRCLGYGRVST